MKYISAQPAIPYYLWQVEVYLNNFISTGVNPRDIQVILGYVGEVDKEWRVMEKYFNDVEFFFYEDTMDHGYQPAVQSHLMEKHFRINPELSEQAIFFHDSDFCFTKPMDFSKFTEGDTWYFSDTISYVGAEYIKSKSEAILDLMCEVVGIERLIVEANQMNSGGAQKLIKNVTADYWKEVNRCSRELHDTLSKIQHIKKEGDPNGIQFWTSSMWAELWVAWKMGHIVSVPKEFDFCWATCPVGKWNQMSFFHNAGVPDAKGGLFFKGAYTDKLPYKTNIKVDESRCSSLYYDMIINTKTCLKDA